MGLGIGLDMKLGSIELQSFGPELFTNGDGSSTVGYSASGATLTSTGGRLRVTNTAGFGEAFQLITTVIGKRYCFAYQSFTGTAPPQVVGDSTGAGGANLFNDGGGPQTKVTSFVATSTSTFLTFIANSGTIGQFAEFDTISFKQYL